MLCLLDRLLCSASRCQGEKGRFDGCGELSVVQDDCGDIVRVGDDRWRQPTRGQGEGGKLPGPSEAVEIREQGLEGDDPVHAAKLAPLWNVGGDVKDPGEKAVDANSSLGAVEKNPSPEDMAVDLEAHALLDSSEKAPIRPVVGLLDVGALQPSREAELLQACCQSEVPPDVVTYVSAEDVGGLTDIDEVVTRQL